MAFSRFRFPFFILLRLPILTRHFSRTVRGLSFRFGKTVMIRYLFIPPPSLKYAYHYSRILYISLMEV